MTFESLKRKINVLEMSVCLSVCDHTNYSARRIRAIAFQPFEKPFVGELDSIDRGTVGGLLHCRVCLKLAALSVDTDGCGSLSASSSSSAAAAGIIS